MSECSSSNGVMNGNHSHSSIGHDLNDKDAEIVADDEVNLSEFFNAAHMAVLEIERSDAASSDAGFQRRIAEAARQLEWATVSASRLDLFSSNEEIEELPTSSLKFLLLPVYLGRLMNKKSVDAASSASSGGPAAARKKLVDMVVVYFEDFLTRLGDYGFFSGVIPTKTGSGAPGNKASSSTVPDLKAMNAEREVKIRRFKESKDRRERLAAFEERRKAEKLGEEEERKYWLESIEDWMNKSLEDLTSLKEERDILEFMAQRAAGNILPEVPKPPPKKHNGNPFAGRPFILTRDSVQKQVFGMGYPSLPSMTVEEWYDEQAALGLLPTPDQSRSQMDQAMIANDPDVRRREEEQKEIEDERKVEEDDEEERRKKNEWDDWKDDHRRGWGNRKNMG